MEHLVRLLGECSALGVVLAYSYGSELAHTFAKLLLSLIEMELDGTRLVALKARAQKQNKTRQQCLFPETETQSLKIIHRLWCEQFHAGTLYRALPTNHISLQHGSTHGQEGSEHYSSAEDGAIKVYKLHSHEDEPLVH